MYDTERLAESIKRLTKVGIALSATQDINAFFELILKEAMYFTNSDAGTIYTISENQRFLDFKVVCTQSKNIMLGAADIALWPSVPLYREDGSENKSNFVSSVAHAAEAKKIDNIYEQDFFDASGTRKYDEANAYKSISMAAIPLKNHEKEVMGVIQLINALDQQGKVVPFEQKNLIFLESLASQAAIALSNKKLIQNLETLLYQFIKSIATAIDRKCSSTSGHISRVATLSEKFLQKIQEDTTRYKDITFSANEIRELSLAAWMHDVGKITTPVYIQDKSTKLETIFDRMELVKTRLELVIAVIEKNQLKYPEKKPELAALIAEIRSYEKVIERCNRSVEWMPEADLAALQKVYDFHYCSEGKDFRLLTENEFCNLSIRRGTLLPKEIAKMHEHATVTLEMLSELTFPRKFRNIPLYASSHHEKLNGKGYPSHFTEADLPLQARVIAIADIFDALTASDRPYKTDKKLSETLIILAKMAKDRDIDPDLLSLFLESGLYSEYAADYLKKEQIDAVDVSTIKAIYEAR